MSDRVGAFQVKTIASDSGRDQFGRFVAGNRGGPGNPHVRKVAEYRNAIYDAVPPEDVSAIITSLVARAKKGNVYAAKFVISYLVGAPPEYAEEDFNEEKRAATNELLSKIPISKLIDLAREHKEAREREMREV